MLSPSPSKQSTASLGNPLNESIEDIVRRLKIMEERFNTMRSKVQLIEQNMLSKNRNFYTEIKTLNLEFTDTKKEIEDIRDKMSVLLKEMEGFSRKEDVDVLRKYIDFWNPITFVTKNEIEEVVRDILVKLKKEQSIEQGLK